MPVDECLHKFGFSDIYIMYFQVYTQLYKNPSFLYIHPE